MSASLDLILLPIVQNYGQEPQTFPGLHVAVPPRRLARGRDRDQLILHLTLLGDAPLALEQINQLLAQLAQTYYKTSGSVTAAQRAAAESLNQYLLDRNLRTASTGRQVIGALTQVVMREDRLALAQSGPAHAFLVTNGEAQHLYDPQLAGPGLGLSRSTGVRFFQATLKPNDALLLTPQSPPAWMMATLQGASGQGPESLRRRLISQASPDLNAVLIQAQPGKGRLHLLRPIRAPRPRPASAQPLTQPPKEPSQGLETQQTSEKFPPSRPIAPQHSDAASSDAVVTPPGFPVSPPSLPSTAPASRSGVPRPVSGAPSPAARKTAPRLSMSKINTRPLLAGISAVGGAFGEAARRIFGGIGTLAKRMLPDASLFTLPAPTMALIAIAVPIVVVTVATIVYFQRGRAAQYQVYFSQAEIAAQKAEAMTEPEEIRQAWTLALGFLEQAEAYQYTPDSDALRVRAQSALDNLDSVERLDFRPAIKGSLEETAAIIRIVAFDNDLYMLNSSEGLVLRATFTSSGYVLDPTFQCGPGPSGTYIVGAIIDIAPMPRSNDLKAAVMAVDSNGILLYCIPGESPLAAPLAPPDTNWGRLKAITQDTGDLYILDPQTNAVWIYRGLEISSQPRFFFDEQIPPMQDVIDIAVNRDELYLLHTDGHLSTCTYSGLPESPTRCEDPTIFTDQRPGRQNGALIQDAKFNHILFIPPPDPSIYLLDSEAQAIYHFSVRLTFQRQFRSLKPLPEGSATAFAINRSNRTVFLAIGNQIHYAALP